MNNVCIFCGNITHGGGTERMATCLANALSVQDKYQVSVLSKTETGHHPFFALNDNVAYQVLEHSGYKGIRSIIKAVKALRHYIRDKHIDILIIVDVSLGVFTLPLWLLSRRTRCIYWDHFSSEYINENRRMKSLRKIACMIGDAYVTLTEEDAQNAARWAGGKAQCIQNFCPYEESNGHYSLDKKTIISIGNLIPVKGFDMALEVANAVLTVHPDWEWRFYGNGSQMDSLIKQAKGYTSSDRIHFCGRISDIDRAYREAAMLVMTSRSEGYGLVLSEAQAFMLPTVAFDVPYGPRNIIRDGIDGFLIEPFDLYKMEERINQLIDSPELRKKYSIALNGKSKDINREVLNSWLLLLKKMK